jgi:opacity protein-like surface antigen
MAAFLPLITISQSAEKKTDTAKSNFLYLDFSVGLSQPLGAYGSTSLRDKNAGLAATGSALQINFDWLGKNKIGLGLQYTYQRNPISSSLKNDTIKGFGPVGTGNWTNHYLMAGISVVHFFGKVYFEGRALFGTVISSSLVFRTIDPKDQSISSNVATGLAGGIQAGVGYELNPKVALRINLEYDYSKPGIHRQYLDDPVWDPIQQQFVISGIKYETKKPISALLIKAGVVIKLSK